MLNLRQFNHCMHIPSFQMPTIKHVWQPIQQGYYAVSIDLQDAYLHITSVKHHHCFCNLFGRINIISRRFCHLGLLQLLGFSFLLLNSYCSFAITVIIIIYLDDILVLVHSKHAGKRAQPSLCLELHINFSNSELCLTSTFVFRVVLGYGKYLCISAM